jgi:hypothetical protein
VSSVRVRDVCVRALRMRLRAIAGVVADTQERALLSWTRPTDRSLPAVEPAALLSLLDREATPLIPPSLRVVAWPVV